METIWNWNVDTGKCNNDRHTIIDRELKQHLSARKVIIKKTKMEIVSEEEEVLQWSEIKLPSLGAEPELERETGERRRGRDILIAIDHGPNSKHAFDWAIVHLCRLADTIHLVHAVSSKFDRCISI